MPVDITPLVVLVLSFVLFVTLLVLKRDLRRALTAALIPIIGYTTIYVLIFLVHYCGHLSGLRGSTYQLADYSIYKFGWLSQSINDRDYWLVKAADAGHPEAKFRYGWCSMYGTSNCITKDLIRSRMLFAEAEKLGQPVERAIKELNEIEGRR